MRLLSAALAIAGLLVAGVAGAAPNAKENSKGGSGPEAGGSSPGGGSEAPGNNDRRDGAPDAAQRPKSKPKAWEVGALWELHRLIRQDDLEGAAANKVFNYWSVYARYDITQYDRVSIRGGLYQRFLADTGESGVRLDDVVASYTRRIPLPADFSLRLGVALTAPTSFSSQKEGLITSPRANILAEKRFGKYVTLDARVVGDAYIMRYSSAEGGNANPRWRLAGELSGDVAMPFLPALSVGASAFTGYIWYYDVGTPGGTNMTYYGATNGSQFSGQPVQQEYGGEIFVRYNMPELAGVKSDLTLALAQGDPSLGYTTLLHDGVQHFYGFYRLSTEVYGVFAARY